MPSIIATSVAGLAPSRTSTSAVNRVDQGSVSGAGRWSVANAWVLKNKRLALRYDRLGFIVQSLLQTACIFLVAGRLAREF